MTLKVVNEELNDRQGTVTVEAETQEEVTSSAARQLAIDTANKKLNRPGSSGGESPYPVDENGQTSDDLIMGRSGKVVAYRCDYKLTAGL